jgi:hypothetical protein
VYTKIDSLLWTDDKYKGLSDDGKMLFVYVLTCPHRNSLGLYFLPPPYAAYDLGWTAQRYDKALTELLDKGLIKYNKATSIILIKNFLKYNPLENTNQVKAALNALRTIPANGLDSDLQELVKGLGKGFTEPLQQELHKRIGIGYAKQEEEKENETEDEEETDKPHTQKIPPPIEEVAAYCRERHNDVNPQKWHDFYSAKGWMVGKNKMKDWKAAVRTWEQKQEQAQEQSRYRRVD